MRVLAYAVQLMLTAASVDSNSVGLPECQAAQRMSFSRKLIRLCRRPDLLHDWPHVGDDGLACAMLCVRRGVRCRGFRLADDDGVAVCQTMKFDRCSLWPSLPDCSRSGWAFVRSHEGLPSGQLCPADFGHGFCGSVKFADGMDRAEVEHVRSLMPILNRHLDADMRSFFLGGFRPSPHSHGPWFWHDCNATLLPEVWGPGQPNEGDSNNKICAWYKHSYGLDDLKDPDYRVTTALCECVNPFE